MYRIIAALAGLLTVSVVIAESTLSALEAPAAVGARSSLRWAGQLPDTAASCQDGDGHTALAFEIPHSPNGGRGLRLSATVTPSGAAAAGSDIAILLQRPDGRSQRADARFAGAGESLHIDTPQAGIYRLRLCAVSGPTPQPYTAELQLLRRKAADHKASALYATAEDSACSAPSASLKFEQVYIDEGRAGGEPFIVTHPDGHLLWGSHAGTTHFYSPAAPSPATGPFIENYTGQTYYYYAESDDDYQNWHFVPRQGPGPGDVAPLAGLPASGFSDPEFAIDAAGNVYVSEINLVNVAVSKSSDGGRSYGLQNVIAFSVSDRQWMAADRENELYMAASGFGGGPVPGGPVGELGHFLAKSTDGGVTFGAPHSISPIIGDIQIDQQRGILYSMHLQGSALSIARFPNIRNEDTNFTVDVLPITVTAGVPGADSSIGPTFDLDAEGNLYAVWPESGAVRPAGMYYAWSTNQGESWSKPLRVDATDNDKLWPWIAVGAPGQVAIGWLQTDVSTGSHTPGEEGAGSPADRLQSSPDKPWHVMIAHSSTGLGCTDTATGPGAKLAAFTETRASDEPPHTGTVCQGGTLCQAQLIDRRLGDYFSLEVAPDGTVHIAVSDTRRGGAVALPLHIRQVGGPTLDAPPAESEPPARLTPAPAAAPAAAAMTRGGAPAPAFLLAIAAVFLRRRLA